MQSLGGGVGLARFALVLLVSFGLTGCFTIRETYVDSHVKDVDAAAFKKPDAVHSVQVLYEFQTKGIPNARATSATKQRVLDQVAASGLFASSGESPSPDGALLTITVNNVPLTDHAMGSAFMTGFTWGLAGSEVSDGYVCTARYKFGTGEPIEVTERHAIYTTVGLKSAPPDGVKAATIQDAVATMLHQMISNALNDLSHQPAFK